MSPYIPRSDQVTLTPNLKDHVLAICMVEKGKHISKKNLDLASILQGGTVKSEKLTSKLFFPWPSHVWKKN